uniref:V-type proton ATPase subunit a n=1 Tax=Rhabditophanes sp. KR3021 TaxID=114890 RepID=A0AC35U7X6_9BILA
MSLPLRSEAIELFQLIIEKDGAFNCLAHIGQHDLIHFKDLKNVPTASGRTYVREIQRCASIERSLRYLTDEIIKSSPKGKQMLKETNTETFSVGQPKDLIDLEAELDEREKVVKELSTYEDQLKLQLNEMIEFHHVLIKVNEFFIDHMDDEAIYELENLKAEETFSLVGMEDVRVEGKKSMTEIGDHVTPWFVAGVIDATKRFAFERLLWRACRRTAFVRTSLIEEELVDSRTCLKVEKCAFIIFFKGKKLQDIVNRVCSGFNATQFPCPKTQRERSRSQNEVNIRMDDLRLIIDSSTDQKNDVLEKTALQIIKWWKKVHLQKTIYYTLNSFKFDKSGNFFVAECWIPVKDIGKAREVLESCDKSRGGVAPFLNLIEITDTPPTYTPVNKFTSCFQTIVNAYGVPSYQEINPAIFTIITFPFLFAIMFGDAGHGLILALTGLILILKETKINASGKLGEIQAIFFGGRYIMLMMGVFSIYTGIIYNDAFGKSINVFGSKWKNPYSQPDLERWASTQSAEFDLTFDPKFTFNHTEGPYEVGVDPIWNIAKNKLNFLNSLKMKASVLLGIAQMTFGLFLSFFNYWKKRSWIDILTNFVPQLCFLSAIFVYLCLQIIMKWVYYSVFPGTILEIEYPGTHCAPSLLIGLINMVMLKERKHGFINETTGKEMKACYLNQWYHHQDYTERILLSVALLCIPIMLFGKPLFETLKNKRTRYVSNSTANICESSELLGVNIIDDYPTIHSIDTPQRKSSIKTVTTTVTDKKTLQNGGSNGEDNLGDLMVYQAIHSIEFILGCVSHTASYLRLWALSLAHARVNIIEDYPTIHSIDTPQRKSSIKTVTTTVTDKKTLQNGGSNGEDNLGDLMVYQAIHSIEFILGCVSHTASYLRLWALSLAHAQLSEVLWHMILVNGLNYEGKYAALVTFITFFIFFVLTITILVVMEGLSAFLHALRLHWIEFQSKFYEGNGYAFAPFSLATTLETIQIDSVE